MVLKDKVVLVAGGSRGIGRSIALELTGAGAHVIVNYFRHGGQAKSIIADIEKAGFSAIAIRAHLGKAEAIEEMFTDIENLYGGLDILVCSAASGRFGLLMDIDQRTWDHTADVTLRSGLRYAQSAAP